MSEEIVEVKGVKISDLEEATTAGNLDYLIINQGGETKKIQRGKVKAQKISELTDDVGYLTQIPGEYMTESEVKEFTDAEIAKIREVLNTWTEFKNNGGNIGGAINFPMNSKINNITKPITITNNTMYYRESVTNNSGFAHISRFEDDSLGDRVNQNGIEFRKNYGETSGSFRPLVNNTLDLGSSNYKWKDIYLNDVSKSQNGYTKLPNGLIMQWGKVLLSGGSDGGKWQYVGYPISFPTSTLNVQLTQYGGDDYYNVKVAYHENGGFMLHGVKERNYNWIAIGY